jgi:hypothetical protein
MHTFSPAKMWIGGLTTLQKPLLHLHTQFNRDLPWAEIDMDFMNLNQSAHGELTAAAYAWSPSIVATIATPVAKRPMMPRATTLSSCDGLQPLEGLRLQALHVSGATGA